MASRRIEDCVSELQEKFAAFQAAMEAAGLPFIVTCTARTVREQIALYAQGREPLEHVNTLRRLAHLAPISFMENGHKVTWTLASKHLIDLDDGNPDNDKSRAFDIALLAHSDRMSVHWNLKADVNGNAIPDYDEAGRIGEAVGLRWGGRFPSPDRPHFEV
jgi:hypothetical protein